MATANVCGSATDGDNEVLAAGFRDDARIRAIAPHVRANRLPHAVEHAGAAGEMHAARSRLFSSASLIIPASPGTKFTHARRNTGIPATASSRVRDTIALDAVPDRDVTHQRRRVARLPPIRVKLNGEMA